MRKAGKPFFASNDIPAANVGLALPPESASVARQQRRLALLVAFALTALALALRLHGLTAQSLWWDEVSSWQQARLDWGPLLAATAADNYPPLHNLLLHIFMQALGETAFALRLPSAILGASSVLALYWVGARIVGRPGALLAAGLLCLSGFHLWFSQEARMYALLCFTTILYAGAVLRFAVRAGAPWAIASIVSGALLLYSHPFGALNWISLALAASLCARAGTGRLLPAVRLVLWQVPALLLYLPWAAILLGRARLLSTAGFWLPEVTPGLVLYYFEVVLTGPGMLLAVLLGTGLAVLPPVAPARKRVLDALGPASASGQSERAALWTLLAWALLPAALATVLSLVATPVLFHRYLIGSLPALLLLAGMGFARLPKTILGVLGLGVLGFAALLGLGHSSPGQRDDFRDIATALAGELRPGDCVVMSPESAIAMRYYRPQGFACVATPRAPDEAGFGAVRPDRIFVVLTASDQADGKNARGLGRIEAATPFGVSLLVRIAP